jgi:hypothetical protein
VSTVEQTPLLTCFTANLLIETNEYFTLN